MPGLKESVEAIYLTISDGKIVQKFKEPAPGLFEVKNKEGRVHWERRYSELEAKAVNVFLKESEWQGKKWKSYAFRFQTPDGTIFQIEVGEDSQNLRDLAGKFIVADLSQMLIIKPYSMKSSNNGRSYTNSGVTVTQNGEKIVSAFYHSEQTSDGKFKRVYNNGYPPFPADATDEDKEIYKVQVRKYVKAAIEKQLMPKFKAAEAAVDAASDAIDEDDLPF